MQSSWGEKADECGFPIKFFLIDAWQSNTSPITKRQRIAEISLIVRTD